MSASISVLNQTHSNGAKVVCKLDGEYQTAIVQSYDSEAQKYAIRLHGITDGTTIDMTEEDIFTVQQSIRIIQRDTNIDQSEKAKAIQNVQMPPKIIISKESENNNSAEILTSSDAPKCIHYECMCVIVSACCNRVFQCRLCHDEHIVSHKIDRFATSTIICKSCDTIQPISNQCINCQIQFSTYYCNICKLWKKDDDIGTFHCKECGICRIGQSDQFQHCLTCGLCIPVSTFEEHICLQDKFKQDCPVCRSDMLTSRDPVVTLELCGHPIHQECLKKLYESGSFPRCPLCKKSVRNLDEIWDSMQSNIDMQPMPPSDQSGAPETVEIICNDCEASCPSAPFHFLGVRCLDCGSFNTTICGKASE